MPLGDPQLLINANRTREVFGTRHLSGKATNKELCRPPRRYSQSPASSCVVERVNTNRKNRFHTGC
jgi:hypothetical protein